MSSAGKITLHVLGPLELRAEEGHQILSVLHRPRRLALLTYLALESHQGFVRRTNLLPVFWPESSDSDARAALRKALYQLRSSLGEDVLVTRETDELRLDPDRLWCDVVAFEEACSQGHAERALALWTGEPLVGIDLPEVQPFEEWREEQRSRLNRLVTDVSVGLIDQWRSEGRTGDAVTLAREALARSPFDETVLRCLIRAMDAAGDRAGALLAYESWVHKLEEELEGEPAPETSALVEEVRERTEPQVAVVGAPRAGQGDGADSSPPTPGPQARQETPVQTEVAAEEPGRAPVPVDPHPGGWQEGLRRWAPWLVTAGVALVAGALTLHAGSDTPPQGERILAVLPFEYSGDADFDYLGQGMMSLLGSSLETATDTRTMDNRILVRSLDLEAGRVPDPTEADPVVSRIGATHMVAGSVVEMDGQVQLEASIFLQGRPTEAIQRAVVRGPVDQVFSLAEELADRLLPGARDPTTTPIPGTRLTGSLPALRAFLEGEQALELGNSLAARSSFERAVDYDSSFALAHLRLAIVRDWLGGGSVEAALTDAMRTADRLSSGDRKLLDAFLARYTGDIPRAMTLAEQLVEERPEMVQAWFELGEIRFHYGATLGYTVKEQTAPFRRVIDLDPRFAGALLHLARVDVRDADSVGFNALWALTEPLQFLPSEALELEMFRAYRSGSLSALDSIMSLLDQRNVQEQVFALRHLATASLDPDIVTRYGIQLGDGSIQGQYRDAHLLSAMLRAAHGQVRAGLFQLEEAPDHPEIHGMRAVLSTLLCLPSPDSDSGGSSAPLPLGFSRADLASPLDAHDPNHAFLLGVLAARSGDLDAARTLASQLRRVTGLAPRAAVLAEHNGRVLEAHLAWVQSDPAGALVILGHADTQPHGERPSPARGYVETHERFLRGESLLALGRYREALQWFGGFPEPGASDLHYLGIATLRQAQIHDALGERTEATASYERFLELWPDPDPELLPLVERARDALRRLRD